MSARVAAALLGAAAALLGAAGAQAGLALPHYVYAAEDLPEAIETARGREEPLAFVYTDRDTGCNLASSATADAFRAFKDDAVVVYACSLRSSGDWKLIPEPVREALRSPAAGRYIPKAVVTDPEGRRVLAVVPYVRDPSARVEALERAIEASVEALEASRED